MDSKMIAVLIKSYPDLFPAELHMEEYYTDIGIKRIKKRSKKRKKSKRRKKK